MTNPSIADRIRDEALEEVASAHGAARDSRDERQDHLTDRLLRMYEKMQDATLAYMQVEGDTVREIKDGLARLEKQVDGFVKAFPEGDAEGHRRSHEDQIEKARDSKAFRKAIKLALAISSVLGIAIWIGVLVWKGFLLGPK